MISHLSDCIEKKYLVGYGELLTSIFRKFGVPLDGLQFPMSPNNKIGAKCLNNLHPKLNDNGILEDANEEVEIVDSEKDKEEQKNEHKDQETLPPATTEKDRWLFPKGTGGSSTSGKKRICCVSFAAVFLRRSIKQQKKKSKKNI